MASVDKLPSGRWRTRWVDPNGKPQSQSFPFKRDADRLKKQVEHDLMTDTYIDKAAGDQTFEDFAQGWQAVQVYRPGTAVQVEGNLRRHVYPALGARALRSIKRSDIQGLVKSLPLAPATVEVIYRYTSTIFSAAVADKLIAASPCVKIKLPEIIKVEVVPMAVQTVEAIREAMPPHLQALITFAAGTGLRQGECFGLTVDRIDFDKANTKVDRQAVQTNGGPPDLDAPLKTTASYRTVPLAPVVVEALRGHLSQFPPGPERLVFTDAKRQPLQRSRFGEVWHRSVDPLALAARPTFHDLRHFYASLLIHRGLSVKVVQARLGHKTAKETMDTYAHLWPDSEDESREAVQDVLGL